MGFSVTAANVIFAVAMLTALSAASETFWKDSSTLETSQRALDNRAVDEVHTNLTISGVSWKSGPKQESFTITNSGTVGLNYTQFAYLFDGVYTSASQVNGFPQLNGVSSPTSDLLLPGDKLSAEFALSSQPQAIQVVSENGIYAHYP